MLLTKEVMVKWRPNNRKHYEKFGYKFTKFGDEFCISINHATMSNSIKVEVKCDYCGAISQRAYPSYVKYHNDKLGDCCVKCRHIKGKNTRKERYGDENYNNREQAWETTFEHYGVKNPSQSQKVKDKKIETTQSNFGVDNPMQAQEVKNKARQSMVERFGTNWSNPLKCEEIKNRTIQTSQERYGTDSPNQNAIVKSKKLKAYRDKYNTNNPMQSPEVIAKGWETKKKNGSFNSSKPEQYLYGLLCGYYGSENVEWQKRADKYSLDCELIINNIKIDVEYNGWYWHVERDGAKEHDVERKEYLLSENYKQLNIISDRCNNNIEDIKQIINAIDTLVFTNTNVLNIELHTQ